MKIFAHRGYSLKYPENTICAFEAAAKAGAHGIELDVHLSKDGIPVVIHDETLERTTNGRGLVEDKTVDELLRLDAGGWKQEAFKGEKIPALEDVFKWASSNQIVINVEIKFTTQPNTGIEESVLRLIKDYQLEKRIVISSFNHYSLKKISTLNSQIELAALFSEGIYEPQIYVSSFSCHAIHPRWPVCLIPGLVERCREKKVSVRPWTVNDPSVIKQLASLGCDAVITDDPLVALQVLCS